MADVYCYCRVSKSCRFEFSHTDRTQLQQNRTNADKCWHQHIRMHLTKSRSATLIKIREIKNTHPVTISNGGSSMGWKSSFSSLLFTSLAVAPPFSWFFFSSSTLGCSAGFSVFLTGFFKLFSFPFSFPSLALPSTLSFFFTLNLFLSAMIFFLWGRAEELQRVAQPKWGW